MSRVDAREFGVLKVNPGAEALRITGVHFGDIRDAGLQNYQYWATQMVQWYIIAAAIEK
jgi:hypothetical protein